MAVFPFTVRATDSEGSYADRQFNITVRNSRIERFMVTDTTDAWTSPDGAIWTQRVGQGGFTCAYGNGFWLIFKTIATWNLLKSTDGINFTAINQSSVIWLDETGNAVANPTTTTSFDSRMKLKFWNGKFWMLHRLANTWDLWSSVDGVTWNRKRLYQSTIAIPATLSASLVQSILMSEDNGSLFIPHLLIDTSPAPGYSLGMGWVTTDGVNFTQIKNASNSPTAQTQATGFITRFNGFYIAQHSVHNNVTVSALSQNYLYSTDAVNWTIGSYGNAKVGQESAINSMFYVNGLIYAFPQRRTGGGATGHAYYTSADGLTWTENVMKVFANPTAGVGVFSLFRNGLFLVAPDSSNGNDLTASVTAPQNGFRISVDGTNWTTANYRSGLSGNYYSDVAAM